MPYRSLIVSLALFLAGCAGQRTTEAPGSVKMPPAPAPPSVKYRDATSKDNGSRAIQQVTTLAELERYALSRHGDLDRLRLERRSFEERAAGARAWPNPRLSYRESLVEVETRVGPQERSFGIDQPIPWPGLLGDRAERENRRAEMVGFELLGMRRQVLARLRSWWAEYFYLGRAIEVRRETLDLLDRLERLARDRLAVGRGGASHVIRVQVEVARLQNEIATLEDRQMPLKAAILSQVGLSDDVSIPIPDQLEPRAPEPSDEDLIRALLLDRDADIARAAAAIRVAESELELAGYEGLPKLGVGIQTIITGSATNPGVSGSGNDPWIVGLQLEVPIDRRRVRAAERSARDLRAAAIARARQLERDRSAALEDALFLRTDGARRVALHEETLIPKALESLQATESGFTGGEIDFTNLIDAERILLEFRLSLERARTDRWLAEVRLRAFLGEPGESLSSDGSGGNQP